MTALAAGRGPAGASGRVDCEALPVADLRGFLAGPWMVARRLRDRRLDRAGSLVGWADFVPAGGDLAYRERGDLRFAAYRGGAFRDYLYRFPTAARARVCFPDGRPFHDLDLAAGAWTAVHRCGADLYRGRFAVLGPLAWQVAWRVSGPRKELAISSLYLRDPCGKVVGL